MENKVIMSGRAVQHHAGVTSQHVRVLARTGRIVEEDGMLEGGEVIQGYEFTSVADYFGWSPAVRDRILIFHGVNPDHTGLAYIDMK